MAQNRLHREPYFPLDAMCCIRYLTDVTPETPAFAVVPRSRRTEGLDSVRDELGQHYREVPLYAPAGTAVLYDNGTYHTRLDGSGRRSQPGPTRPNSSDLASGIPASPPPPLARCVSSMEW